MARAHITLAPMAAPCTVRQTISRCMLVDRVLATEASTKAAKPSSKMGRRPKRSDSGPQIN